MTVLTFATQGDAPSAWVPLEGEPSLADRRCVHRSQKHAWVISATPRGIQVAEKGGEKQGDSLPFEIPPADGMRGRRTVAQVADGWIVGFDRGEFDAGLWWFSSDGQSRRDLLSATLHKPRDRHGFPKNVRAVVRLRDVVLAFQGLNHLGVNRGRVLAIPVAPPHEARVVCPLPAAPFAGGDDGPERALVVTDRQVLAVDASGNTSVVAEADFLYLYPTSVARSSAGEIFVAMGHFIFRITRTEQGSEVAWLIPSGGIESIRHEDGCVCAPGPRGTRG